MWLSLLCSPFSQEIIENVQEVIILPVHVPGHWQLLVINKPAKRFDCVDSLGGQIERFDQIRHVLSTNLPQECFEEYAVSQVYTTAVQTNGSDCGVFVCEFARIAAMGMSWPSSYDAVALRENLKELLLYEWEQGQLVQGQPHSPFFVLSFHCSFLTVLSVCMELEMIYFEGDDDDVLVVPTRDPHDEASDDSSRDFIGASSQVLLYF